MRRKAHYIVCMGIDEIKYMKTNLTTTQGSKTLIKAPLTKVWVEEMIQNVTKASAF